MQSWIDGCGYCRDASKVQWIRNQSMSLKTVRVWSKESKNSTAWMKHCADAEYPLTQTSLDEHHWQNPARISFTARRQQSETHQQSPHDHLFIISQQQQPSPHDNSPPPLGKFWIPAETKQKPRGINPLPVWISTYARKAEYYKYAIVEQVGCLVNKKDDASAQVSRAHRKLKDRKSDYHGLSVIISATFSWLMRLGNTHTREILLTLSLLHSLGWNNSQT